MKKNWIIIASVVIVALPCFLMACNQQNTTKPTQQSEQAGTPFSPDAAGVAAVNLVDMLSTGNFAGVVDLFDATMKAALPESRLKQTWTGLAQQVGTFKNQGETRADTQLGYTVIYVPCTFEHSTLNAKVVFNSEGQVAGLFFQ